MITLATCTMAPFSDKVWVFLAETIKILSWERYCPVSPASVYVSPDRVRLQQ